MFKFLFISFFTATSLFAQIPTYVPSNGLVGWWPFDGNANDLSGNNLNGNFINSSYTAGIQGQCATFNGNNSMILQNSTGIWHYFVYVLESNSTKFYKNSQYLGQISNISHALCFG